MQRASVLLALLTFVAVAAAKPNKAGIPAELPKIDPANKQAVFIGYTELDRQKMPTFVNVQPVVRTPMSYPPGDLAKGLEGSVSVTALVEKDGRTSQMIFLDTKATTAMVLAASEAIGNWIFPTIAQEGKNVRYAAIIPVTFTLPPRAASAEALPGGPLPAVPVATSEVTNAEPGVLEEVAAEYPLEMKQKGRTDSVMLAFEVDETGSVQNVSVVKYKVAPLAQAAVDAIVRWKFKPAYKHGVPVRAKVKQNFDFGVSK